MDEAGGVDEREQQSSRQRSPRLGLAVLFALGVFTASTVTPPSGSLSPASPLGLIGVDKWLHLATYAGLGAVVAYAVRASQRRELVGVVLLVAAFGGGIEVVQAGLPARAFSGGDLMANGIGAGLGVGGWWAWLRRSSRE